MNVGIIGHGAWGRAIGDMAERAGHAVILDGLIDNAELWMIAIPAAYFRDAVKTARKFYGGQPIIICTKGMEPKTHKFMSEVLADALPACKNKIGVLSGPQFAAEVSNGVPTGSTLAGPAHVRKIGRKILAGFFLEETNDIIGAQICGAGKNAAAIVAGYYSIKASGENERALCLTQAWAEVADIGAALGAKMRTFVGLAGTGDLFLSATSPVSRNFSAGIAIAKDRPAIGTIEGLPALHGLIARAKKAGIKTPMLNSMAEIISKR